MTAIQRRRLIWTAIRTTLLTMAALALSWSGFLNRFERVLYDLRALRCQWLTTAPTTQLVHLDIDDNALSQVGRWPWEREKLADILDEIRLAEPKVLSMDILFPDPAPETMDKDGKRIDPDALLAESLRKFGRVLVPTSLTFEHHSALGAVDGQLLTMLTKDPELMVTQCCNQLRTAGINSATLVDEVNREFLSIRTRALYERIQAEIQGGLHDRALIKKKLLPHTDPLVVSPLERLFNGEFTRAAQDAEVMRFTLPMPAGNLPVVEASETVTPITPLAIFSQAARYGAFVDYLQESPDGTVRQVPLMAEYRGRLLPHMSLATACAMLNVDVKDLRLSTDTVTIPRPGGRDIVIPVTTRQETQLGDVGLLMDVPMFGKRDGWLTMYDYPAHRMPTQHVSVYEAWRICQTRQQMARNEISATDLELSALKLLSNVNEISAANLLQHAREAPINADVPPDEKLAVVHGAELRKLIDHTIADLKAATSDPDLPADLKAQMVKDRLPTITRLTEDLKRMDLYQAQLTRLRGEFPEKLPGPQGAGGNAAPHDAQAPLRGAAKHKLIEDTIADLKAATSDPNLPAETKVQLAKARDPIIAQLREVLKQVDLFQEQLIRLRSEFHEQLYGKAVLLGGIGTGNIDTHPTCLDNSCPGVIVHGAVISGILTGRMWRVAPQYTGYVILTAIGLLTGAIAGTLSPMRAFLATSALTIGYLAINGYVLFDFGKIIVQAGGPVVAAAMVWSGITLTNFIFEVAERRRITHRFSSYVDPSLVNWIIDHPEQARFDGETREMTMGFTDLAGFTTLSETLGERAVPLLKEYMGHMIPAIRANRGFVCQLMGDGIFFFFNAPVPDPEHASHAVTTILAMHKLLERMNQTLPQRGFPTLGLRGGITTGRVILGDVGSREFADYTVIGDAVNTAARLESANKVFGSKILANARTVELLNGEFLVRPIANLRVAGKAQGVQVFEPLCRAEDASSEQRKLADLSGRIVSIFQAGNFAECVAAAKCLEQAFGKTKFTALYRELSLQYLAEAPVNFDGQVVLTEK